MALAVVFLAPPAVKGQGDPSKAEGELQQQLTGLVNRIIKIKKSSADAATKRSEILDEFGAGVSLDVIGLSLVIAHKRGPTLSFSDLVRTIEDARVDEQVGGSDANAGGTSLVSKGSVPAILGWAVENGALTRDVSGTTITFRGNPVGLIKAFGKSGFLRSYEDVAGDPATRYLSKLSFAVSFDASRGDGTGMLTGDLQQVSSYSFRWDIVNRRDPRHSTYRTKWYSLVAGKGTSITVQGQKFAQALRDDPNLRQWLEVAREAIVRASPEEVAAEVERQLFVELPKVPLPDDLKAVTAQFGTDMEAFLLDRGNVLETIANGPILTFEYTNIREVDTPSLSNLKLIAEGAFFQGRVDLTANASLTIHNSIPPGSNLKKVRDFQLAAQLDVPLGEIQKIGSLVLSFSSKYERMMEDAMMPGGMMVPGTKGDIAIGQLKLTLPLKGSGVKIPLSITFANRTELIKEKEVRGNIGITFDLDSIFARLKP
jgi:hypothetical protein